MLLSCRHQLTFRPSQSEVIAHGQPRWLGRQHLDIWIPSRLITIEYQGLQHSPTVEFFGGEEAFERTKEQDDRKRSLCQYNDVTLIEISYDHDVPDGALAKLLTGL